MVVGYTYIHERRVICEIYKINTTISNIHISSKVLPSYINRHHAMTTVLFAYIEHLYFHS